MNLFSKITCINSYLKNIILQLLKTFLYLLVFSTKIQIVYSRTIVEQINERYYYSRNRTYNRYKNIKKLEIKKLHKFMNICIRKHFDNEKC